MNENQLKNDVGIQKCNSLGTVQMYGQLERLWQLEKINSIYGLYSQGQCIQLENVECLQELTHLGRLEKLENAPQHNITFTCKNYWEFDYEANSIVYADPPYINTVGYNKQTFDFERFDNWVQEMKEKGVKVYISEYTNHNNAWRKVGSIEKYSLMDNSSAIKTKKQEKVFCNI